MATVKPYNIQCAADMEPDKHAMCRFDLLGVTTSIPGLELEALRMLACHPQLLVTVPPTLCSGVACCWQVSRSPSYRASKGDVQARDHKQGPLIACRCLPTAIWDGLNASCQVSAPGHPPRLKAAVPQ